jgi:hypothetical protein
VYNFRKNIIDGLDEWYPMYSNNKDRSFHDMRLVSQEVYERGESENSEIMRANIFIDRDAKLHTRKVMMYMDWLGIIGGLRKVLDAIFIGIIFRGFSRFNAFIEILY